MRLTSENRQHLLDLNEGYSASTSYSGKNSSEDRDYEIRGGELHIRAVGKTSWADSRYDKEYVADNEQTHRFLREHLLSLNKDGIE